MPNYDFSYSTQQPTAHLDGSGMVGWFITAHSQPVDDGGWSVIGAHSKPFNTPAADLAIVNAMPDGTAPQRQAKNTAYKDLLAANVGTQNVPASGWSVAQLEQFMDNNDAATAAADDADDYITNVLNQEYPVRFTL